jgi:hypothetical protein
MPLLRQIRRVGSEAVASLPAALSDAKAVAPRNFSHANSQSLRGLKRYAYSPMLAATPPQLLAHRQLVARGFSDTGGPPRSRPPPLSRSAQPLDEFRAAAMARSSGARPRPVAGRAHAVG